MSNRRLDEDSPASLATGILLIPSKVTDDRFGCDLENGRFDCDGVDCHARGFKFTAGTWEDDDTRELLAQNRSQAYLRGKNC
eukprot:6289341-Pyramimonas_sp.AAC.1